MFDPISSSARQDLSEMAASWSRVMAPAPGMFRSITYFGMTSPSRYIPQQVSRQNRSYSRSAVTEDVDQFVQVLDLQTVVEGKTEPVSPMEQRKRAKDQQVYSSERMPHQGQQLFLAWRVQPSQGKRQREQEQVDRDQHRGNYAACAEEHPQK